MNRNFDLGLGCQVRSGLRDVAYVAQSIEGKLVIQRKFEIKRRIKISEFPPKTNRQIYFGSFSRQLKKELGQ